VRRGPSGKVVCCVCRKWLDRSAAVGVNGKSVHVEKCFATVLERIGVELKFVNVAHFAAETAFRLGLQHGEFLRKRAAP
jgi:hypothetical protein